MWHTKTYLHFVVIQCCLPNTSNCSALCDIPVRDLICSSHLNYSILNLLSLKDVMKNWGEDMDSMKWCLRISTGMT